LRKSVSCLFRIKLSEMPKLSVACPKMFGVKKMHIINVQVLMGI
jgi:hypothetical protein